MTRRACFAALSCFDELQRRVDVVAIDRAARHLAAADRIGVFGYAASAVTSLDLQHRLARLRLPVTVESDPHSQAIRLMAMSRTSVGAVRHRRSFAAAHRPRPNGRRRRRRHLAIASPGTRIARLCSVTIAVDCREDTLGNPPSISRLARLLVINTLLVRLRNARSRQPERPEDDPQSLDARLGVSF